MIDIDLIRTDKETVKKSEKARFKDPEVVEQIYDLDQAWKKKRHALDLLNRQMNVIQNEIKNLFKKKSGTDENESISKNEDKNEKEVDIGNLKISDDLVVNNGCSKNDSRTESNQAINHESPINNGCSKNDSRTEPHHLSNHTADNNEASNNGCSKNGSRILDNESQKVNVSEKRERLIKQRNELKIEQTTLTSELTLLETEINTKLKSIGNILKKEVFISTSETNNPLITTFTSKREITPILDYPQIFEKLGGCDTIRGSRISGHRGYYLFEDLALLGLCLGRYAIDFMRQKGYKLVQTPVFMSKETMTKTCQLSDFDDQLFKLDDDFFMIATSEQPLTALHMNENIFDLPLKYVGQSLCFRKEAGAHGKDNQGIFRVHQFEKIEQFVICHETESDAYFQEMISVVQEFYESLDVSFRVVSIVSGEMNDAAAVKYDLEAWFPKTGRYRELVSCSNCTDYQSRELNVRYGYGKSGDRKEYVHMLNCTVVAVQRALCCLVENYQDSDGVVVPGVLRQYFGKDKIYY